MSLNRGKLRFHSFVLDADGGTLSNEGSPAPLSPKALKLLSVLVSNRGRIVEKDELMEQVWGDTFVEEGNLAYTIRLLRKTLGDNANSPTFIENIPRRGYRFIAAVTAGRKTIRDPRAGPQWFARERASFVGSRVRHG